MKKSAPKAKAALNCRKISSFFTKQPVKCEKSVPNLKPCPKQLEPIIKLESEDEESPSLLNFNPKSAGSKRKLEDKTSGVSPPVKKELRSTEDYCQPSTSGFQFQCDQIKKLPAAEIPSTSGSTPIKTKAYLTVKTPEKLLTSEALRKLQSPINTEPKGYKNTTSPIKKTPRKHQELKSSEKQGSSSPNKKRTPKKLFERSPKNLNEFNVEVLENFVKITPSKKEIETNENKTFQVQMQNEKTPVKAAIPSTSTNYISPISKVKTKLDFSSCVATVTATIEKENFDTNNVSFNFDDDSWDASFMDYNLDLSETQHCTIASINQNSTETILTVKSTQSDDQAVVTLRQFWTDTKLCEGDTVRIVAIKSKDNSWLINNQGGLLVLEPDILISATTVVNSVFCKRQTIFKERFRGFDPTNKFMIMGSMVHLLIQDVLRNKLFRIEDIKGKALEILNGKEWIKQIYESGESMSVIAEEFLNYVMKVYNFVHKYVKNDCKKAISGKNDSWKGHITSIEDIEENIWCVDLGIKGKIDLTVKDSGLNVIPIEVKTGRASVSLAHRGQVILYIMMMNKLGYKVSSGLLLYLKEDVLKEIPPTPAEKRDIILLRNELAYYLARGPKIIETTEGKFLQPGEIPEPIDHPACEKCAYNGICMAYSKYNNEDLSSNKRLKQVHDQLSTFITSTHVDYFMHWASLLSIEMSEREGSKILRDIYTLPPEQRKIKGKCLINLSIASVEEERSGICCTQFEPTGDSSDNFLLSGFTENCYVVVSVNGRPAVASGFVLRISMSSIAVSLDRNLSKKYKKDLFHIDSYDSTTFLTYNLGSLALILDPTESANNLRNIVVDRQPATFQSKLPKSFADVARPILKRLNRVQQRAVLKAIAANEYFLIKGMPGTGKTATIVALIQLLIEIGKTVLITSHTHSAVDNVCLKLINFGVNFMRLGSEAKMDPNIRNYSEQNLTKDCNSSDSLEAVYDKVKVLAVTCLGSGHPALSKKFMDVCIVDESTQVLQSSVLRPLSAAKTFILIGDPDQLPAVVRNTTALELGMNESLFERLDTDESRISLNLNYRMNEPITALANALTYNGELQIGADRIAKACLNIPKLKNINAVYKKQYWLKQSLDVKLESAVQFIDTGPTWNLQKNVLWATNSDEYELGESQRCVNIFEAAIIYRLVRALVIEGAVSPNKIGVIATYKVQVALLTHILKKFNVNVNTVDQFQGKDNNVIIYSCSKSRDLDEEWAVNPYDLTEDKRRLNVAITRAKHKLIIVGDMSTLQKYSTFKKISKELEKNIIKLANCDGFDWEDILNLDL